IIPLMNNPEKIVPVFFRLKAFAVRALHRVLVEHFPQKSESRPGFRMKKELELWYGSLIYTIENLFINKTLNYVTLDFNFPCDCCYSSHIWIRWRCGRCCFHR